MALGSPPPAGPPPGPGRPRGTVRGRPAAVVTATAPSTSPGPAAWLPGLFDEAAIRQPHAVALDLPPAPGRGRQLVTYAQLKADVDELARVVVALVGHGQVVAVLLSRTTGMLCASQLAVLRAGSAQMCLDAAFPHERLLTVLRASAVAAVLTDLDGERRLRRAGFEGLVLRTDQPVPSVAVELPDPADPWAPAYVVHTSATTGTPQSSVIAHRSILGLIRSDVTEFGLGPGDRVGQSSSSAYDSSVEETWMALASGATLVVIDDDVARSGPDLVPWLRAEAITVLCPTPTLLRSMGCSSPSGELPGLRLLRVGGEALPADIAEAWSVGRRVVNGYGANVPHGHMDAQVELRGDRIDELVSDAMRAVLGLPHVGLHADFFTDLGGTSLHAAMLTSRLRTDPATASLVVRDVYQDRNVSDLARTARERQASRARERAARARSTATADCPDVLGVPASGRAGRARATTAAPGTWLIAELVVLSAPAYLSMGWLLPRLFDVIGATLALVLAPLALSLLRPFTAPVAILIAVLAKKALIGAYRAETLPVRSGRAVRMWMVRQLVRIVPWRSIAGTEYQNMALRVLGARIGQRVHIHCGVDLTRGGWDLLDVGDDVTLGQGATVRLVDLDRGHLVVGPVALGAGAVLDVRSGVGPGSRVGRGARVSALSSLPAGAWLPDGALAHGVPARGRGAAPPVPELTRDGRELSPRAHGAALVLSQAVMRGVLALPYGVLGLLFVGGSGLALADVPLVVEHPLRYLPLIVWAASAVCLALASSVVLAALAARSLGTVEPGVISRWSRDYIRVRLKSGLVDHAGKRLGGTLLWPGWLRAAGMRIGSDCAIGTIVDVVPELVTIGTGTLLADGICLGGPRIAGGRVSLAPLTIGRGSFIGNHTVLPGGATVPDDVLIGVAMRRDRLSPSAASWFGQPPPAMQSITSVSGRTRAPDKREGTSARPCTNPFSKRAAGAETRPTPCRRPGPPWRGREGEGSREA
ncbi:AMP-binding protein [Streptomyces sp. NPDC059917]|uniref:non-ribosomal peptide synthetase n=1 Tax=Streptomyces sp. NPDC059917 TaxID=3347002 RepID=UPI00365D9483